VDDTMPENVLMGSRNFTVKEIEVFGIADETALPNPVRLPRESRFARDPKNSRESAFLPVLTF
jgi:hypothetical protein